MTQASANLNVMIKAARRAARSLVRDFGEVEHLQVSAKGPGDFVSRADHRSEEIVREELTAARPNYGWLGEESAEVKGADPTRRWIVDPLDGTTNFLHGLPHWAVSIALEHKGEIVAAVVYDPVKDEMFTAEKGAGAWMNDRRLRVSGRRELIEMIFATGIPFGGSADLPATLRELAALTPRTAGIRRWGAAALDLAYVAAGPPRRLLGARAEPLGRGGRPAAGARGRRLRRHDRGRRQRARRRRASPPPTPTSTRPFRKILRSA